MRDVQNAAESGPLSPRISDLWTAYGDILWEKSRHRENVYAFLMEIDEISVAHKVTGYSDDFIDLLVSHFRKKNNSNATINRKLSALFKLLRKAERMGKIPRLPSYLRLKERNGRVRFLSHEEEEKLFSAIGEADADHERLCVFLIDSGARVGEALALQWGDIHGRNATFWITKSGRSRTIPLTQRALAAVQAAQGAGNPGPFSMIDYQRFRYHWNRARKDVGLGDDNQVVPHILRHTCASRLVQAGIDLRRVQTFLGHQTIQMTLRYAHLATNDLAQCAAALDMQNEAAANPPPSEAAPLATKQPKSRAQGTKSPDAAPEMQRPRQRKAG